MEDKTHYTPTIEEFHVGFEYEVFQKGEVEDPNIMSFMPIETEDKWYKFTYPDPFVGYQLDRLFKSTLRVKYLDKEGIEDLGFTYAKTSTTGQLKFFKDNVCLFYRPKTKELGTFTVDPSKNDYMMKYITDNKQAHVLIINNKSELKRLLKQLKIL